MQNDIYYTINQLASYVKKLEEKIKLLEDDNKKMTEKIDTIQKNPPVNIERIDYHFDQLKIERLEGTLNIGINPSDLQDSDEISVNSKPVFPPVQPRVNTQLVEQLEPRLTSFIDNDLKQVIEERKQHLGIQAEESYTHFIQQDIRNQLDSRMQYYLQKIASETNEKRSDEQLVDDIYQAIINDMQKAVHAFFSQFPKKGEQKE